MSDLSSQRDRMVERQIVSRGVRDPAVLAAMRSVPRERFLPPDLAEFAYRDSPLPIAQGQTISQPSIVALMREVTDCLARLTANGTATHAVELSDPDEDPQAASCWPSAIPMVTRQLASTSAQGGARIMRPPPGASHAASGRCWRL